MGAAGHLGIRLRDYDARIQTFIPHYEDILDAAASSLTLLDTPVPLIVELGVGSGALAARCLSVAPRATIVGVDSDPGMLAAARQRLGLRLTPISGDFLTSGLPRCDAVMASFALHHIPTLRRKKTLYAQCFAALRQGGLFVSGDCYLASDARLQGRDRAAWLAHLEQRYGRRAAREFLRAWAKEDVYTRLEDEIALLRDVGFTLDIPWRRDGFAVIVAAKRGRARER